MAESANNLSRFLDRSLAWSTKIKPQIVKPLPGDMDWTDTLGSVLALLFVIQAVTGMALAAFYSPSPDAAYESILYIMNEMPAGGLIRGLHHWGAAAMIVLVTLHLLTKFLYGSYKAPRQLTWIVGVLLLFVVLGFGFTGYLLPWDLKAYWATVVGTNVAGDIPLIGDWVVTLLRGGPEVSGLTLTRFFSVHVLVLPALLLLLVVVHIYLVRVHDPAGHWDPDHPGKDTTVSFYPHHMFRGALAFVVVGGAVFLLALFAEPHLEAEALTPAPEYLPRPEWYFMWLFKLLTFFPGWAEWVGSLLIPLGGLVLLLAWPWIDNSRDRGPAQRPNTLALGVMVLVGIVYLTAMGLADSKAYNTHLIVPDRPLTQSEEIGLAAFAQNDCAYCHQILGRGGRREGPDLSNVDNKDRTEQWLIRFIKDPTEVRPWSQMPKYELTDVQLQGLADYTLAVSRTKDLLVLPVDHFIQSGLLPKPAAP